MQKIKKIFKKKDIKTYVTLTVNRQTQYAFRLKKFGLNCQVVLTFSKKLYICVVEHVALLRFPTITLFLKRFPLTFKRIKQKLTNIKHLNFAYRLKICYIELSVALKCVHSLTKQLIKKHTQQCNLHTSNLGYYKIQLQTDIYLFDTYGKCMFKTAYPLLSS